MRHRTSHKMEMNDKFRFLTDMAPGGLDQGIGMDRQRIGVRPEQRQGEIKTIVVTRNVKCLIARRRPCIH